MRISLLAAGLLLAAGCSGGGGAKYAPVTGQFTLGGQPVADARVTFQPIGSRDNPTPGTGSYGRTDADGRFTLSVVGSDKPGAAVGKHRVEVTTGESSAAPIDPKFPDAPQKPRGKAAQPQTYSLEVDVPPEGIKDRVFELKAK